MYELAWYVYLNGKKIFTEWYSTKQYFEYIAKEPGKYSFRVFAKNREGKEVSLDTQYLEI